MAAELNDPDSEDFSEGRRGRRSQSGRGRRGLGDVVWCGVICNRIDSGLFPTESGFPTLLWPRVRVLGLGLRVEGVGIRRFGLDLDFRI